MKSVAPSTATLAFGGRCARIQSAASTRVSVRPAMRSCATLFTYADPELPPTVHRVPADVAVDAYGAAGVTHVVTHEHTIPFSRLDPQQMARLAPHLRLLAEFTPYTAGPAGGFEAEDAFYIPFYAFAGVERPGPRVRVYAYEATP